MNIVVCGSLAYDRIMSFPGKFSDHILPEKLHLLNVCFQVNGMQERFGGTAGNIAYALRIMGEDPIISASIGHDYQKYFAWFMNNGISTQRIRIVESEFTASAYITTDADKNQITGFHPGAMNYTTYQDFGMLDPGDTLVIISPGNLQDMINYPRLCKEKGIDYIFDPGQSLPMLNGTDLMDCINGCRMLICNEYEMNMIHRKTGLGKNALLKLTPVVIVTQGSRGSLIITPQGETFIPIVESGEVLDPTGAGDSYRAGLISGLVRNMSLENCARLGTVCASFAVECYGTQEYKFSRSEFDARLSKCLSEKVPDSSPLSELTAGLQH